MACASRLRWRGRADDDLDVAQLNRFITPALTARRAALACLLSTHRHGRRTAATTAVASIPAVVVVRTASRCCNERPDEWVLHVFGNEHGSSIASLLDVTTSTRGVGDAHHRCRQTQLEMAPAVDCPHTLRQMRYNMTSYLSTLNRLGLEERDAINFDGDSARERRGALTPVARRAVARRWSCLSMRTIANRPLLVAHACHLHLARDL